MCRSTFCLGNAIKYLWRHEHKNGYEDLEKAGVYLDKVDGLISDDSTSYRDSELYEALSSIHLHELEKYNYHFLHVRFLLYNISTSAIT